jgi:hypothetical protein
MVSTLSLLLISCVVPGTAPDGEVVNEQFCGRYALSVAASFLGMPHADWATALPPEAAPYSLSDMDHAARMAGLDSLILHWDDVSNADLGGVCILLVRSTVSSPVPDHFVACFGSDRSTVLLGDFPLPPTWVSREKLSRYCPVRLSISVAPVATTSPGSAGKSAGPRPGGPSGSPWLSLLRPAHG